MSNPTAGDEMHLRRAIGLAQLAVENGSRPFGAVVVSGRGEVVAEGYSTQQSDRDWTAHAEMNVLRQAGKMLSWDELGECTLYASGDPCPMCSGAMYWSNVRRLVFGIDEAAMRPFRAGNVQGAGLLMSCREVLERSPYKIEVIGPMLVEEAIEPHRRYWKPSMAPKGWV
jgi:tRNA(Arg) A34 adenosine deaminase TadA